MGFLSANHGNLARHGTTAPALDWQGPSRGDYQGTRQGAQRPPPPKTALFTQKDRALIAYPGPLDRAVLLWRTLSRYLSLSLPQSTSHTEPACHENTDPTLPTSTTLQRPPHLRDRKPQKQCTQEGLNEMYQRVVIQG